MVERGGGSRAPSSAGDAGPALPPVRDTSDPAAEQRLAEVCAEAMWADDRASRGLGMRIVSVGPGIATLEMTVRHDMVNGHAICHGGFITTLADSTFAFACNTTNELTVAAGLTVDFTAPAHEGDVLTANARVVHHVGRSGLYDITVTNQRGQRVAEVRGRAHRSLGRTFAQVPSSKSSAGREEEHAGDTRCR